MSTKISKGARLHLLRVAEKMQCPMRAIRMVPLSGERSKIAKYLASLRWGQMFTLPPGFDLKIVHPADSP